MDTVSGPVWANHPLRAQPRGGHRHHTTGGQPAWPSFRGTAQLVGSAAGVTVFVDPAVGAAAVQNAQDLLGAAPHVVAQNNAIFGITGGAVDIVLFALGGATDGTGGADHGGCDFITGNAIEVDVCVGQPARVTALFEAELSECAMNGRLCGYSTGEALSRWCAAAVSGNALADFATAPSWAANGMRDWVNTTDTSDQDPDSTGCGMAFLSWLLANGHTLPEVAQRLVALGDQATLAQLYADLTGAGPATAWSDFHQAVTALPGSLTSDDPFNALPTITLP